MSKSGSLFCYFCICLKMSILSFLKGDGMLSFVHLNSLLPAKVPQSGVRCLLPGVGRVFPYTTIQHRLVTEAHYLCPLLLSSICISM